MLKKKKIMAVIMYTVAVFVFVFFWMITIHLIPVLPYHNLVHKPVIVTFEIFFFLKESFNLLRTFLVIAFYHHTKAPISFWWKRG